MTPPEQIVSIFIFLAIEYAIFIIYNLLDDDSK